MATYQDVALQLALAREDANKTQQDAAKFLGVTYQAVSNWERGYSKIDSLSLLKLLIFYEVDIYDFMEKCGFVFMNRVDHSDFYLSDDARELAEAYSMLPNVGEKNLVRRACGLGPLKEFGSNANINALSQTDKTRSAGSEDPRKRPMIPAAARSGNITEIEAIYPDELPDDEPIP